MAEALHDPGSAGPGERSDRDDDAGYDGSLAADFGEHQRDESVSTEEGEVEDRGTSDGGGQPPPGDEGTGREEPLERNHGDEEADDDAWHGYRRASERGARERKAGSKCEQDRHGDEAATVAGCGWRANGSKAWEREQGSSGNKGDDAEEDDAPAEVFGDDAGDARADQAGQDPRRCEESEHPGTQGIRIGAADGDVRNGRDSSSPEALDGAGAHKDEHGLCEASYEEADSEQDKAKHERKRRTGDIGPLAGECNPDEAGEEEGAKGPPVQVDVTEVVFGGGKRRGDSERLECDEGDRQDESDGQSAKPGIEDSTGWLDGHAGMMRRGWKCGQRRKAEL